MKKPVYLVPMDFSLVSIASLRAAIGLAKFNDGSVLTIHIVGKQSEKKVASDKFTTIMEDLTIEEQQIVESKVLVGGIYEDIAKVAEIVSANLIVMGTHGAKGMQKLFGSHALRLVSSTGIPFVIMQQGASLTDIKSIVMPFNFEDESIQIANFAGNLARQFDATIHLVGYHDQDEWLRDQTQANQQIVRDFFKEKNIKYEIVNLNFSNNYISELLEYTDKIEADLIATSFFIDTMLPTMNSFVQALIENDRQIPILTVNSEELMYPNGRAFISHQH